MGHKDEKTETDTLGFKIASSLVTFGAAWLAQKVIRALWKTASGKKAPESIDDEEATLVGVVAFAAVSAGVASLARALATRGAARAARRVARARSDQQD